MKKWMSLLCAAAMICTLLLPGCGKESKPQDGTADTAKDTLVIGQYGDAPNLDPHNCLNDNGMRVMINIYDPLIRMDENFEPVPCVAERWEVSEDGVEYTFYIKKGIKFQNGEELTVSDVVFTINRGVVSPQASPSYSGVEKAEAVGEDAVKVTLTGPNTQILAALSLPLAGILCEKAVTEAEANGGTYGREPVGSGPYKLTNWVTGEKIELTAYEDYHMGPAAIKNVTFRAIGDQSAAVISLETGDIDAYVDLNQSNFNLVKSNENLTLNLGPSFAYQFVAFNCSKAPFDNVKVRQALAHAVDKTAMVMGINDGVGDIIDTVASPDMVGYTEDIVKYDYNLETAKQLLAEAGYPDGFSCDIAVYLDSYSKYAQVLQASLKDIGVNASVTMLERAAFDDLTFSGDADIFFYGNTYSGPDMSDVSLYNLLHSKNIEKGSSRIHFRSESIDSLLDEGRVTLDNTARGKIYEELLKQLSEEAPIVPFIWTYKNIATNKDLQGVYVHPQSIYYVYEYSWS